MHCVVLAGGLGTRLGARTRALPKTLVAAAGRPFANHQLALLAQGGITRVTYCISHLGQMIRDHVGDGRRFNLSVDYVDEGKDLLGTAGALRCALDQGALADRFFVTYGDSYLPIDYQSVWSAAWAQADPLMTVYRNGGQWDSSNVIYDSTGEHQGRVRLYEKGHKDTAAIGMDWIDYGLMVFRRHDIAARISAKAKADLSDICHRLSIEGHLAGYEVTQRFYEIGTPAGLADFEAFIGARR